MVYKNAAGVAILCIYVNVVYCIGDKKAVTAAIHNIKSIYAIKKLEN
jgi:hypothetical protein